MIFMELVSPTESEKSIGTKANFIIPWLGSKSGSRGKPTLFLWILVFLASKSLHASEFEFLILGLNCISTDCKFIDSTQELVRGIVHKPSINFPVPSDFE